MASTPCYCNTQKQQGFNVSLSAVTLHFINTLACTQTLRQKLTWRVYYAGVCRTCACPCELYVWGDVACRNQTHPELRKGHWWSPRVSLAKFLFNICFIFPCQNGAVSHEKTSRKSVSDGEIIRAEWVLINDSVEGGAGNVTLPQVSTTLNVTSNVELKGFDLMWCRYVFVCVHVYTQCVSLKGLN